MLRAAGSTDPCSVRAIQRLKQCFVDPVDATSGPRMARVVLGWHGCPVVHYEKVCRDGARSFRTTDAGYFGAGSYFAMEADYARQYAELSAANSSGERCIILFAVSVSQAYAVAVEKDYRLVEDPNTPQLHGFSTFYSGDPSKAIALMPRCDAHFVPVKDYGYTHPRTRAPTAQYVGYQACDESDAGFMAHELVIASHHRCVALAVVFFRS